MSNNKLVMWTMEKEFGMWALLLRLVFIEHLSLFTCLGDSWRIQSLACVLQLQVREPRAASLLLYGEKKGQVVTVLRQSVWKEEIYVCPIIQNVVHLVILFEQRSRLNPFNRLRMNDSFPDTTVYSIRVQKCRKQSHCRPEKSQQPGKQGSVDPRKTLPGNKSQVRLLSIINHLDALLPLYRYFVSICR